jgi:fructose-1,6-bisphosphatase/inositol monophosphatase family enzyme
MALITEETYDSTVAATITDFYTGEIWSADDQSRTSSSKVGECYTGGNEQHDLLLLADFYFPENSTGRMKLRNPKDSKLNRFECLNTGSVGWQAVKVACGEADAFFNLVRPKGDYELPAMYLIIKQAGGFVIHAKTGEELGSMKVCTDRIPVIMAKDQEFAEQLYHQLRNG